MNHTTVRRLLFCAFCACVLATGLLFQRTLRAATASSGDVFLKSDYIEIGINEGGWLGTTAAAPTSYTSAGRPLGMIADSGHDGWTTGTPPYAGDYIMPGTPVEGWTVQWKTDGGTLQRFTNEDPVMRHVPVPMTSLAETSTGDTQSAVWKGQVSGGGGQITVEQTIRFDKDDSHVTFHTVLTNVGATTFRSLSFMRSVDPDQEEPWTGNYATRNFTVENGTRKIAVARAPSYPSLVLGLGTIDPRAAVAVGGFDNVDPQQVLDGIFPTFSAAAPHYADEALSLAFGFGDLASGQSVSFDYTYMFDEALFDEALNAMEPVTILGPTGKVFGSAIPFMATTADVANTTRMDFYVDGALVGTDNSPDEDGVFATTFSELNNIEGVVTLKAVATFADGSTAEASSSVQIDTSGVDPSAPALVFTAPADASTFAPGAAIPIAVDSTNAADPVVDVSFYRESVSKGSQLLGTDASAPFTGSFDVSDLAAGEIVTIRAIGHDALGREATVVAVGRVAGTSTVGDVFLKGDYIELGINKLAGSFGTVAQAPSGFTYAGKQLGFIADYGKDGWTTGTPPYAGDYFVPGTPEEGWTLQWVDASGQSTRFNNYGLMSLFDSFPQDKVGIPTSTLTNTSSGNTQSAVWEGLALGPSGQRLKVTQTIRFRKDALYFAMNTVITNVGTVPVRSVEFMRNVDPDQEEPWTSNFATKNYTVEDGARHLAVGQAPNYPALTLGLGTIDDRARVRIGGFSNRDPQVVLNSAPSPYTAASPHYSDEALSLAYQLGTLAPGQSTSFNYAYILNAEDLDAALASLSTVKILQPTGSVSGSDVLFQATTTADKLAQTTKIDFFVNDALVGEDATADSGGIFETTFDARDYPNSSVALKAIATFADGTTAEQRSTVTVDNSGPEIAFAAPVAGSAFIAGQVTPVAIDILDMDHPPVRVSFFRESASGGSVFLGEDTSAPFTAGFDVTGLPDGETVVIKAVAADNFDRTTTIQVSGTATVVHDQTIAFGALPGRTFGDPGFDLSAVASSGLPVTFSVAGSCAIAGTTVNITGAGSCTVEAMQAGNLHFNPARPVFQTFTIAPLATVTSLTTTPNPAPSGAPVTLTATVQTANPNVAVTDSAITFKDGSTTVAGPIAVVDGTATATVSDLAVGDHAITAELSSATPNFLPSSSSAVTQTIFSVVTFSEPITSPDGSCICSPLLMNAENGQTTRWYVKATGKGALTIAAIAHTADATDAGTVVAKVYDAANTLQFALQSTDAAGSAAGTEVSDSNTIPAPVAGAIYRVDITTSSPAGAAPLYRLKFQGADAAGIASPTAAAFEPAHHTKWLVNTAAGEPLSVRLFAAGGAETSTVTYTITDPTGLVSTGSVSATADGDGAIAGPAASVAGTWSIVLEDASDPSANPANGRYGLDKIGGDDRGVYLAWDSAGVGTLHLTTVTGTADGAPFIEPVDVTVRGPYGFSETQTTAAGVLDLPGLPAGIYTVSAVAPTGWTIATASLSVPVFCDGSAAQSIVVRDTTPPVITAPADLTVAATDLDGAPATFDVTANDPGRGPLPVVCTPGSGSTFPIGATEVNCTATDAAGNAAHASFTITVDASAKGRMSGGGFIDAADARVHFELQVAKGASQAGRLSLELTPAPGHGPHQHSADRRPGRFSATAIMQVVFVQGSAIQKVAFSGTGEWNGQSDYTFEVHATDAGEPGRGHDTFAVTIRDASGATVASYSGPLAGGNVQSMRLR